MLFCALKRAVCALLVFLRVYRQKSVSFFPFLLLLLYAKMMLPLFCIKSHAVRDAQNNFLRENWEPCETGPLMGDFLSYL